MSHETILVRALKSNQHVGHKDHTLFKILWIHTLHTTCQTDDAGFKSTFMIRN